MKTFIRTVVVLVVLNLAMACSALAQNVSEGGEMEAAKEDMKKAGQKWKESKQKTKEAVQYDMEYEKAIRQAEEAARRAEEAAEQGKVEEAEHWAKEAERRAEAIEKQAEEMAERLEEAAERREEIAERLEEAAERRAEAAERLHWRSTGRPYPRPFAGWYGSSGRVFVIPTSEMKAEDLVTIAEDMRVMSRIFDKKLDLSPGGIFQSSGFNLSIFGLPGARSTEAIFLQGYGALFLMKVDFPLSPSAKEQEELEEEPKEPVDELWKETRQEMYEPADAGRRTDEEEDEYDEEKVEEMKETLIKALKHTTNIRNLKADESVILTVAGSGGSSNITDVAITGGNKILIKNKSKGIGIVAPTSLSDLGASSPTVMTIRVKKSDVDAFAKDQLDFDEFRQRVQIFTY
jgi:hypothetical protein